MYRDNRSLTFCAHLCLNRALRFSGDSFFFFRFLVGVITSIESESDDSVFECFCFRFCCICAVVGNGGITIVPTEVVIGCKGGGIEEI